MDQQNQSEGKKKPYYRNRRRKPSNDGGNNINARAMEEAADFLAENARSAQESRRSDTNRQQNRGNMGGNPGSNPGGNPNSNTGNNPGGSAKKADNERNASGENRPGGRNDRRNGGGNKNRPQRSPQSQLQNGNGANPGKDNARESSATRKRNREAGTANRSDFKRDAAFGSFSSLSSDTAETFSKPAKPAEPEPDVRITLDLNDILPPIALEKYSESERILGAVSPTPAANEDAAPEATSEETPEEQVEVVGVRFTKTGKMYYFAPGTLKLAEGQNVIVDTARGAEFGEVVQANTMVPESATVPPLRAVLRAATPADIEHQASNKKREEEAFRICLDRIKAHGLDMKLVEAQYTFDNAKLLFYFTSAGRVDFRELVKDLASVFRTRIELRQIGIRDEAKLMGGLGICGRPLCCASYLSDFVQVSIKMAKEQNLSLNSSKISGACGRLMCCLNYEYPTYCAEARKCPAQGAFVATPDGKGTVTEINPLAGEVKVVLLDAAPGTVPKFYHRDKIRVLSEPRRGAKDVKDGSDVSEEEEIPQ